MLRLDLPENKNQEAVTSALEAFKIQDGDKIRISPILPSSEQTVYLDGHVFSPGKRAYREGMRVTDLIHSYADLLPEPAAHHAEIIRLARPITPRKLLPSTWPTRSVATKTKTRRQVRTMSRTSP